MKSIQEHDNEGLSTLISTVTKAYSINPRIKFEVFIHKVDGLSDDQKIGIESQSILIKATSSHYFSSILVFLFATK
jgi:hypothetical protein